MFGLMKKLIRIITKSKKTVNIDNDKVKTTTLEGLANGDYKNGFWKVAQSKPGLSAEEHYAKYEPGEIVVAQDEEKWLSFVKAESIGKCTMYGDMLVQFDFDTENEKFKTIMDNTARNLNGALGEWDSKELLVKQCYSFSSLATIRLLFELAESPFHILVSKTPYSGYFDDRLHSFGYTESAELVYFLRRKAENNEIDYGDKAGILEAIDEYMK